MVDESRGTKNADQVDFYQVGNYVKVEDIQKSGSKYMVKLEDLQQ